MVELFLGYACIDVMSAWCSLGLYASTMLDLVKGQLVVEMSV